jgi:hypothetical protein
MGTNGGERRCGRSNNRDHRKPRYFSYEVRSHITLKLILRQSLACPRGVTLFRPRFDLPQKLIPRQG